MKIVNIVGKVASGKSTLIGNLGINQNATIVIDFKGCDYFRKKFSKSKLLFPDITLHKSIRKSDIEHILQTLENIVLFEKQKPKYIVIDDADSFAQYKNDFNEFVLNILKKRNHFDTIFIIASQNEISTNDNIKVFDLSRNQTQEDVKRYIFILNQIIEKQHNIRDLYNILESI